MISRIDTLSTWFRQKVNNLRFAHCQLCQDEADLRGLCSSCLNDLSPAADGCPLCKAPETGPAAPCPRCLDAGRSLTRTFALFAYTFPVNQLIVQAKFYRQPLGLRALAAAGLNTLSGDALDKLATGTLIPVPLHPHRLAKRGYNQAELIARTLADESGLCLDLKRVKRHRATRPQSRLGARAREHNLRDAFTVNPPAPVHAVIVDDVMTTGSTVRALAHALRAAGSHEVSVVVLARASL